MDRKFVMTAFVYAIVGLALGIHMAATKNHGQMVTHAHIMLLGFVVTFLYGVTHKLWLGNTSSTLATVQYYTHQVGTITLLTGLFLYYGRIVSIETIDPVLAIASIVVLIGLVLMTVLYFLSKGRS
jgi:hypothetical protein